jgi:hypothetical protein
MKPFRIPQPQQPSEHQLHVSLVQHLMWRGVEDAWWCHIPNGSFRTKAEAGLLKAMGVRAGAPDLLLIHRARPYGLELKRHNGRLSPDQIACHAAMRAAGATVSTAFGLDAALDQLTEWGLLR